MGRFGFEKLRRLGVTCLTFYRGVFVSELKCRLVVIERRALSKVCGRVALTARLGRKFIVELTDVLVLVTVYAELLVRVFKMKNLFLADDVAARAGDRGVFPGQRKSRLTVIKILATPSKHIPAFGNVTLVTFLLFEDGARIFFVRAIVANFAGGSF